MQSPASRLQKYHQCKVLLRASQTSSTKPYNATISGPRKKYTYFVLNENLEKAFQQSKQIIVGLVKKGVTTFDTNRVTCLTPDWSKEGMGFLLLQKHCTGPTEKASVRCPDGWHIVFVGSRFCTDAECRYALIKGEAAAIA